MLLKLKGIITKAIKRLLLWCLVTFIGSSLFLVVIFRYLPVPITTFMLYRQFIDFQENKDYRAIDHHWVDSSKISKHAFFAVVAAEDQKFYKHNGFDVESMLLAIDTWVDGGRLRGASTISQQLAKNLFLIPTRSFLRKGFELWFTLLIEFFWSKERVLEVYLNSVEFGDHLFGVEAAGRRYFGVSAKELSRKQSALLAASLPNPLKYRVAEPSVYMLQRRKWILQQMTNLGY